MADDQRGEWPPVHLGDTGLWVAAWLCLAVFQDFLLVFEQSQLLADVISGSNGEDFEHVEVYAFLCASCTRDVCLVKSCICHAQGEHHKYVCYDQLGPIAINMCQGLMRVAGEYEKQRHYVCRQRFPGRSQKSWEDFCFDVEITMWALGWVGRAEWCWERC